MTQLKEISVKTQKLAPFLDDPALLKHLKWYDEVDSTNNLAKEEARRGAPDGTIIFADAQTAGRGRMGRSFFSPDSSGIYVTVLYRPEKNPLLPPFVTMAACVCTARAIAACCGEEPAIKWVNDLYLHGRKICGILTEAGANPGSQSLDYVVVGIGINLYPPEQGFPEDIRTIAGPVIHRPAPDPDLRLRVMAALAANLTGLSAATSPAPYIDDYRRLSMVTGKTVTLSGGEALTGTACGFTDEGHLMVRTTDGETHIISSGEISLLIDRDHPSR